MVSLNFNFNEHVRPHVGNRCGARYVGPLPPERVPPFWHRVSRTAPNADLDYCWSCVADDDDYEESCGHA